MYPCDSRTSYLSLQIQKEYKGQLSMVLFTYLGILQRYEQFFLMTIYMEHRCTTHLGSGF